MRKPLTALLLLENAATSLRVVVAVREEER
jgi:hypothetical protein